MDTRKMSRKSFIAWLEKKPREKTYCYLDHGGCLVADFLTAKGFKGVAVYSCGFFTHKVGGKKVDDKYPMGMDDVSNHSPHTYGDALDRTKSMEFVW